MKIGTREVGPGSPVFIIAEAGSNHGGSLDRALALIDAAADAGADAVKFQYFRVDRFLVPRPDPESLRRFELPDDWLPVLRSKCQSRDVEFLCTPFDLESLDVVDPFVNAHKVGSAEAPNEEYVRAVEATGKPIILSTGLMHFYADYAEHDQDVLPLYCVSAYPAEIAAYHLRDHPENEQEEWGVSDHTLHPTIVPAAAVALGACVVEKHFMLTYAEVCRIDHPNTPAPPHQVCPDESVSIYPDKFAAMVEAVRLTEKAVRG